MVKKSKGVKSNSLLSQALAFLEAFPPNVKKARQYFEMAYKVSPADCDILDAYGEFLANDGQVERAVDLFRQSIQIQPSAGFQKYFYMGQLCQADEARHYFDRGLELLATQLIAKNLSEQDLFDLTEKYCAGCCSVVELYMTDLCDLPEAQSTCEEFLNKALTMKSDSFEALTTAGMFNKVIGSHEKSLNFCKKALEVLSSLISASINASLDSPLDMGVPDIDSRMNLARTLIDLEETDDAIELLVGMIDADEEDVRIWYQLGIANMVAGNKEQLRSCLIKCKDLVMQQPELKECFVPLLEDLFTQYENLPDQAESDDEADEQEEDDESGNM